MTFTRAWHEQHRASRQVERRRKFDEASFRTLRTVFLGALMFGLGFGLSDEGYEWVGISIGAVVGITLVYWANSREKAKIIHESHNDRLMYRITRPMNAD